jgi:chemotaxis protein CheD
MSKDIKVGISDYKVSKDPDKLITLGLGSCVGIAIYDKSTKIGGLSHIMLPDSNLFTKNIKIEKFANLAIPKMIEEINNRSTRNLIAKIAGGASMFSFTDNSLVGSIGDRNVEAVEKILKELRIPILGKEVGGKIGRTMIVNLDDFSVHIKTVNKEIISI